MRHVVTVGNVKFGRGEPLALIAGPCVIESRDMTLRIADTLAGLAQTEGIPLVFKASYDKANRTSADAYRGPGLDEGLAILDAVRQETGLPLLTDFHTPSDAVAVGEVVDILQVPAFLCRQTDMLLAAAASGCVVNVKKGQFLAPWDMSQVVGKLKSAGCENALLTDRGASFGYNNLVADMRSLLVMRDLNVPVVFDATHSVQRPGGLGESSGGDGHWAPALARAAVATGCDAVFMETHENPAEAMCDAANCVPVESLCALWHQLRDIHALVG